MLVLVDVFSATGQVIMLELFGLFSLYWYAKKIYAGDIQHIQFLLIHNKFYCWYKSMYLVACDRWQVFMLAMFRGEGSLGRMAHLKQIVSWCIFICNMCKELKKAEQLKLFYTCNALCYIDYIKKNDVSQGKQQEWRAYSSLTQLYGGKDWE